MAIVVAVQIPPSVADISDMLKPFDIGALSPTKYLFFTGKGGVGKTSVSCAVAVNLADAGRRVLLVSTDPASNLQDVFQTELSGRVVHIDGVPRLSVANLNPEEAAREYRESVIDPYRGKLPESMITQMAEQLSGSCTVEIAAFDQFSRFITDEATASGYDHIIFDTAPTGHTLRMLELPSAWTDFIVASTHGASCLGQLAGLQEKKNMYKYAVENLTDGSKTTLVLVARPEKTPLLEAERSSRELNELGMSRQILVVNGLMESGIDKVSESLNTQQRLALEAMPAHLRNIESYALPLRSYNILGLESVRAFFQKELLHLVPSSDEFTEAETMKALVEHLYSSGKKIIFTMGKGGVGKTVAASAIALSLARIGVKVHLTSTDPADHLRYVIGETDNITLSTIDEDDELRKYTDEVLGKARETVGGDDLAYIEEDLRSPCTQEIAVFRAFADIVARCEKEVVVIDTAPTGHTLLLLDATQSYHREVERTKGVIPESVAHLLPRLRDSAQTEVVIVTLPEATPVFEASRLKDDLKRAGIPNTWWVVNQCLSLIKTVDPILSKRAESEKHWLKVISEISGGHMITIPWMEDASPENIM